MTGKQLSRHTGLSMNSCSTIIAGLCFHEIANCMNAAQRRSRIYWLTEQGKLFQQDFRGKNNLQSINYELPEIDWDIYGWVCFSHRAAIIKVLFRPMQPSEIKRKAKFQDPNLKMSANNVRDVMRLFLQKGIVKKLKIIGRFHYCYELTDLGIKIRCLLLSADRL